MSLDGAYDPENVFAKILRGEVPCHKLFEDDLAIGFLDVFPQSRGHALIVPKTPARNILEIDEDALAAAHVRAKRVAHAVREALNPDGVVITQFNGAPGGQTVFHLHVHVIPRYEGVALAGHGQAPRADDAELAALAAEIAAKLG